MLSAPRIIGFVPTHRKRTPSRRASWGPPSAVPHSPSKTEANTSRQQRPCSEPLRCSRERIVSAEKRVGCAARRAAISLDGQIEGWIEGWIERYHALRLARYTAVYLPIYLFYLSIYLSIVLSIDLCELLMPEEVAVCLGRPEQPHLQE